MNNKQEWRMVPVEPTLEMVKAAESAFFDWKYRGTSGDFTHTDVFNAMLSAAPTPPSIAIDTEPLGEPFSSVLRDNYDVLIAASNAPTPPKSEPCACDVLQDRIDHLERKARCHSKYATRPILYTDGVNGEQCCRDDLWAISTEELNRLSCDRDAVIEECLQCYSPDDSATDWADKIRRLKL